LGFTGCIHNNDPFWRFEHTGWEKSAKPYHRFWTRLTRQTVPPLLDAVNLHEGMRLLDLATGQGNVAGAAAQRGASVTGVDFSATMLAEARRTHPTIEFREGDAVALPFPDACFEAVVINFGLLHFGQPEQALSEAYRVLQRGRRLGFTVWDVPKRAVGFQMMLNAIQTHGNPDVPLPEGPPFFRFSEPAENQRILRELGFGTPDIETVEQTWRLNAPDDLFVAFYEGTARTGGLLRAQSPDALKAIRGAVQTAVEVYKNDGAVEIPMPAVLVSAEKL
jgi:ubiquinone/menaquinone biosynthesis C-methylase UbiE